METSTVVTHAYNATRHFKTLIKVVSAQGREILQALVPQSQESKQDKMLRALAYPSSDPMEEQVLRIIREILRDQVAGYALWVKINEIESNNKGLSVGAAICGAMCREPFSSALLVSHGFLEIQEVLQGQVLTEADMGPNIALAYEPNPDMHRQLFSLLMSTRMLCHFQGLDREFVMLAGENFIRSKASETEKQTLGKIVLSFNDAFVACEPFPLSAIAMGAEEFQGLLDKAMVHPSYIQALVEHEFFKVEPGPAVTEFWKQYVKDNLYWK